MRQKAPDRLSSTIPAASVPEVPRSKRYFVVCAICQENQIAAHSSGTPRTPATMSGKALSQRSCGSERPAYSTNSSDIAPQHMGRFRQDAGCNAHRPPRTYGSGRRTPAASWPHTVTERTRRTSAKNDRILR